MRFRDLLVGHAGKRNIYLSNEGRQYSTHIMGAPGQGKSKFMEHMIRHDILAGHGLCLIDPHGSLYDELVAWLAARGLLESPHVMLFEPDEHLPYTFGFNPLKFDGLKGGDLADAIEWMMDATAIVWGEEDQTKTTRLARVLRLVLHTLWENNLTLAEAQLLCMKSPVQAYLASRVTDPQRIFDWEYYNSWRPDKYIELFESTVGRLDAFSRHPLVLAMVSQTENVLDFGECMDSGSVILVSLSKLRNEQNRRIVGSLLVNEIHTKGLLREANKSRPFMLYIDECYYCLTGDIERITMGLRKFGVWVVLAHHTLAQLREAGESVYSAVMMIPNKVIFGGLEEEDAEIMVLKLFLNQFNFEEPKRILDKPTVVGYQRRALSSYSHTYGSGYNFVEGNTVGETHSEDDDLVSQIVSEMGSSSESESESHGETASETFIAELEDRPTAVYSPQELIFRYMITLIDQQKQFAIVRRYRRKSVQVKAPWVDTVPITPEYVEDRRQAAFERSTFTTPRKLAESEAEKRREELVRKAANALRQTEPDDFLE